jgi:hypothetical protein
VGGTHPVLQLREERDLLSYILDEIWRSDDSKNFVTNPLNALLDGAFGASSLEPLAYFPVQNGDS